MPASWPAQLQDKLLVDNFQIAFGRTKIRTEMDTGLAKERSRYTKAVDVFTGTIHLDMDDYTVFETFYKTTLSNGTLTFNFVNPMNNQTEVFRFASDPVITPLGGVVFQVQMQWERLP